MTIFFFLFSLLYILELRSKANINHHSHKITHYLPFEPTTHNSAELRRHNGLWIMTLKGKVDSLSGRLCKLSGGSTDDVVIVCVLVCVKGNNILARGLKEGFLHPPSGLLMTGRPAVHTCTHTPRIHTNTNLCDNTSFEAKVKSIKHLSSLSVALCSHQTPHYRDSLQASLLLLSFM